MAKRNFVLKHYQRKKRLYNFFLRGSFRSSLLLVICCCVFAFPVAATLSMIGLALGGIFGVITAFLLMLPVVIYLFTVYCLGGYKLARGVMRRGAGWAALAMVLLPGVGVVLLALYGRKHRNTGVFTLAAATLFAGIAFDILLAVFHRAMSVWSWSFVVVQGVMLVAALLLAQERNKLKYYFVIPIAVAVVCFSGSWAALKLCSYEKEHLLDEISSIAGFSIRLNDALEYNRKSPKFDQTPIAALAAINDEPYGAYDEFDMAPGRKFIQDVQNKYPEFLQALERLDGALPENFHKGNMDEAPASAHLEYLSTLRRVGRYLAFEIKLAPENRETVQRNNRRLQRIRDMLLTDRNFLIGKLVAIALEGIRLDALQYVVRSCSVSNEELEKLLGDPVDWRKYFIASMGEETLTMQFISEMIAQGMYKLLTGQSLTDEGSDRILAVLNPALGAYFMHDAVFFLRSIRFTVKSVPEKYSDIEAWRKQVSLFEQQAASGRYILSSMLLPALASSYKRFSYADVQHDMLRAANHIMHFYRRHGRLPEKLDELRIKLLDIYGEPMLYYKGNIKLYSSGKQYEADGFALYFHDRDRNNTQIIRSHMDFGIFKLQMPVGNIKKIKEDNAEDLML